MSEMEHRIRDEIKILGGKDCIDALKANDNKLENRIEGLNTKCEKLGYKIERPPSARSCPPVATRYLGPVPSRPAPCH